MQDCDSQQISPALKFMLFLQYHVFSLFLVFLFYVYLRLNYNFAKLCGDTSSFLSNRILTQLHSHRHNIQDGEIYTKVQLIICCLPSSHCSFDAGRIIDEFENDITWHASFAARAVSHRISSIRKETWTRQNQGQLVPLLYTWGCYGYKRYWIERGLKNLLEHFTLWDVHGCFPESRGKSDTFLWWSKHGMTNKIPWDLFFGEMFFCSLCYCVRQKSFSYE